MSKRIAVFAYGALASVASAEQTLGRPVRYAGPVRLDGWRRRWSQARDNVASEKTFARADDGSLPPYCLGLNIERSPGLGPNGPLIEVAEEEFDRLDRREVRYDRIQVTADVVSDGRLGFDEVIAFTAKPAHFSESPPPGAVILAPYARAVEAGFQTFGSDQLDLYRETTGPYPVEVVNAVLVNDQIPSGNPREW